MEFSFAEIAIYGRSFLQQPHVKQNVGICGMTHADQPKNTPSQFLLQTKEGRRLLEVAALLLSPK